MNYLQLLNAFRDWCLINRPPTGQIALFYALASVNNLSGWQEWFTVSNQTLQLLTGLSKAGLDKARLGLIQRGLVEYKASGSTRQAGQYRLVYFMRQKVDQSGDQQFTNQETNSIPIREQSANNQETNSRTLYKLNKTKQNEKNNITPLNPPKTKPAKKRYGEFVELTEEEYERLLRDFGEDDLQWMIQRLDIYLGQSEKNRKKYTSHNHVLRGWVADRLREEKEKRGRLFAPSLKKERGEDIDWGWGKSKEV